MHRMPRRPLRAALGALLLAVGLALSGCAGGAAPTASPTDSPIDSPSASALAFASDDAAYAAAIAVYEDYVDARNLQYEGRVGPDPENYLSGAALDAFRSARASDAASGQRLSGRDVLEAIQGESFDGAALTMLACHDYTALRLLDGTGADITPEGRQDRAATRVFFIVDGDELAVSRTEVFARC